MNPSPRRPFPRRGSATLIALGMGFVLLIVIAGVRSFSSYRIQNTITESRNLKALAIAEAGVSMAIAELANNSRFKTHKVNANLTWSTPEDTSKSLQNDTNFGFSLAAAAKGTYNGRLGDGEFKVRLGPIPYQDDPRTLNIDESKAFFLVESMGKIGDTIRVVKSVLQRRFPGREFLLYDGGFLSLVYGTPGMNNTNKFSTGHLYGHLGIEIGRILNSSHSPCTPGTNQELYDMNSIISGDGGIFLYNDIKAQFRARPGLPALDTTLKKNSTFPLNGTYTTPDGKKYGEYPKELLETTPEIDDPSGALKDRVKDKNAHVSLTPISPEFEAYKKEAQSQGTYIPLSACNEDYPLTAGWPSPGKVKILDFGTQLHNGNANVPTNGVIFSDGPLVIKGNPKKGVKIVSRKDIFVAGDFNQAGDPNATGGGGQNPQRYGFPQSYQDNAGKNEDYKDTAKALLKDDIDTSKFVHHQAATIIAHDRIVFDYRSPIDCFENELYPYMKYKIATQLKNATAAKMSVLQVSGNGGAQIDATTPASVSNSIASYFSDFPLEPADQTSLATEFSNAFDEDNPEYDNAKFEELCKKVWTKYRERYTTKKLDPNFGVYKLLKALRAEMQTTAGSITNLKPDKDDDFLFYPEMTTNGMFISCGKRNRTFYSGPDYNKAYDEIGSENTCAAAGIGIEHSQKGELLHRLYGSEIRLNLFDTVRITGDSYREPTRRKLYDESLPRLGNTGIDFATYRLLTWQDLRATPDEFTAF